jgi:transcriptional regulator with XRE-family HTH domain
MGIGKRQPDGKKIAELRKQQGLKQEGFAKAAGIRERLLRYIERTNRPVPTTTITSIASALNVDWTEIVLSTSDETPDASEFRLKLRAVHSATYLADLCSGAQDYEYRVKVDPSATTAEDMQKLMLIVHCLVPKWSCETMKYERPTDDFDSLPFGSIPRLARLQELLEKLGEAGVNVVAGRLVMKNETKDLSQSHIEKIFDRTTTLWLHFVPREVEEDVVGAGDIYELYSR